ncbi:hypothetical protein [Geoalkalibacter sp.]|uniref:hypothetical protein n=1 Tax=Geoalkalibacter sp. TaxID=3041440 RepID=UPI00272EB95F|nr:hypothetical protein [Geoalkalibacter sp.]
MTSYLKNQTGLTVRRLLQILSLGGIFLGLALYWQLAARPEAPRPDAPTAGQARPELRQALELLAGELRALGQAEPAAPPAAALLSAGPTHLSFRDPAADPQAAALVPTLTYILSAGNLVRNDGGFARVLCTNLDLLEFSYRLDDGRRLSRPDADQLPRVRAIDLTLIARLDAPGDSAQATRRGFRLPSGATYTPPADGRPRRQLSTSVHLRGALP